MKKVLRNILAVTLAVVIMASLAVTGISVSAASTLYAPTNVRTSNNGTGFYITWNKAANATGYKVYYKTAESDWEFKETNTNSVKLEDLEYGKLYYLQVQTLGRNNAKGGFTKVSSMTHVRPSRLSSTAYNTNASITVGWEPADGANGYMIAKKRPTDKDYTYHSTANTTFTDTKVQGGTIYYYQIRPYYTNGKSAAYAPWSNTKTLTTLYRPTVNNVNSTVENMNINWNKIFCAESYKVAFMREGDTAWNFRTTSKTYFNVPYPTQGATYYIQVQPTNGRLAGQWSEVFTHEVKKAVIPDTSPQVPVISGVTTDYGKMTVNWGKTVNAVKYSIAYKLTTDTTWKTVTTAAQSYTVSNLVQGATYEVKVNAIYKGTQSAYSNVVKATIPKKVEPQPVTEPVTEPITEPVTEPTPSEPEVTVSNVSVVAKNNEGTAKYEKVGSWAINTNADWYRYVANNDAFSSDVTQAGQHYSKEGYIKSHIEYVDENGKPDASKVTVFFDEKPDMHSTITSLVLTKANGNTIFREQDVDKLATAWQTGKYTFDLPRIGGNTIKVDVSWDGNATSYTAKLYKDNSVVNTVTTGNKKCTFEVETAGNYKVEVAVSDTKKATKTFTVDAEAVSNNDGYTFKLAQTERRREYFCNNCGCWISGSVADHLITESDWAKVKAEAATHEQTSEGSYYNYPRYHKQYFLKDFTNQTVVDPENAKYYRNNWTMFTKPGEEPVDCFTENPYLIGDIHEEEQLNYGGECSLILVPDKSDMTEFIKATIALAPWMGEQKFLGKINPDQGRYLLDENGVALRDENGNPVRNARYETVLAGDRTVESILNMDYYGYHTIVQKCPGGYHDEWVDVIVDYEVFTAPETYTAKLTVK